MSGRTVSTTDQRGGLAARLVVWTVGFAAGASLIVPSYREHDQLRGEVETLWVEHAYAVEYTVNATALTQQTEAMKAMHEGLAARLPDAIDEQALRSRIYSAATSAGLQVDSLEIAPRQLREFYAQRAVRLVAFGQSQAIHAMLLEILHTPPLSRISALSLERTKDEPATVLRLELDLNSFDYPTQ